MYYDLDEDEEAKNCYEQTLEIQKAQSTPNHADVATFDTLGEVCSKMDELEQAKNYLQQALEIRKTQIDPNNIDVATTYNILGLVL